MSAPQSARASFQLGSQLAVQGRYANALAHLVRAVELEPRYAEAHDNLGAVLHALGRFDEAAAAHERAIELAPESAGARNNLGTDLEMLGRVEEAAACYRRAAELAPGYADAHNNLGAALQSLGRHDEALAAHRRALDVDPRHVKALNNCGTALQALGRYAQAVEYYERALAIKPDYAEAHNNLGTSLWSLGQLEPADRHYRRALEIRPAYGEAYGNLANVWVEVGRLDDAERAFHQALALSPRTGRFYRNWADLRRVSATDPPFAAMRELARDIDGLPPDDRMELHFALGKAFGDTGDPEASLRHLLAGNALKRAAILYDEAATLDLFERMRATFTGAMIRLIGGAGDPSPVPVFIVGMPRSGTSLVEQILASHPQIFGAGELEEFRTAMASVPKDLNAPELRALGARYLAALRVRARSAERITDKMPSNFAFLGLIHLALPNARIIHTMRDPIDTCLSCFARLFTGNQPHTYDLRELGRYYRAYETLMEHWRSALPAGVMLDVRYEDLVADFETQARRIVAHCGLDFDESSLRFWETQRPVRTSSAAQVRRPIYRDSVGRSRPYKTLLRPLYEALGIDPP